MKKQLAKLALTATLALAITLTLSCGNHTFEELLGLESSSSQQEDYSSSSSLAKLSSSSSSQQSSSSRLGSSSSGGSVQSGVVYGDPVTYGGETYQTVVIGTQTWFQRNLNYNIEGSKCYDNDPANCQKYGKLYNWETAMEACPSGWHLPSKEDWQALVNFAGGWTAGKKLKAKSGWNENGNGTDDYGFSALPGGLASVLSNGSSVGTNGIWWSATETSAKAAYTQFISYKSDTVFYNNSLLKTDNYFSVRCMKGSSSSSKPSSSSSEYTGGSCNIKDYGTVQIGNQTWMAKNWGCYATGSKCYNNDPANCEKYGRLYNWTTAMATCPSGWHIPSNDDWKELRTAVGGRETAGTKLRATSGWKDGYGTDNYGFAALPGGYGKSNGGFSAVGQEGYWWSATESSNWRIRDFEEYLSQSDGIKDYLYSVRCVKDYSNSSSSSVAPPPSSSSSVPTQTGVIYGPSVTYEGETYKTVKIGTQTWFQRNLNYAVSGSKCRDGGRLIDANTKTCDTYGRLYQWATAMALDASCNKNSCSGQIKAKHKGICPSGWHIPNNDDWTELLTAVGGFSKAGSKLKATSGWYYWYSESSCNGTDDYGFTALPGGGGSLGVIDLDYHEDEDLGSGSWWSATEYDAEYAYRHSMDYRDGVSRSTSNKDYLVRVRCVKD